MDTVTIPKSTWKKIESFLEELQEVKEDYVSEEDAAKYLGISKKTIQNMVYKGEIPKDAYRLAVNNKRMFLKSKLLLPAIR